MPTFRPVRGAIFDLDGVLVDTATYHFEGWQMIARGLGFELTAAQGEPLKGVSRLEALSIVLSVGGVDVDGAQREALAASKDAWFRNRVSQMDSSAMLPGAADSLRWLQARGIPIALASASENAVQILRQVGLEHYFTSVVDGRAVRRTKPDPEVFLLAAHGLGLPPQECVVFEDAAAGVEGARSAGCAVVGLGDATILAAADLVLPSMREVPLEDLFGRRAHPQPPTQPIAR